MNGSAKKKLFYTPGIISLIILPFLFIHFAQREIKAKSTGAITLFWVDTTAFKKLLKTSKNIKGTWLPKRNYLNIMLTENERDNRIKIDFAQIKIREILAANDSVNGLHFQFGDSSPYRAFVKTLDILMIEGAITYMPHDKDLWFCHFPPDTTIKYMVCGTTFCSTSQVKPVLSWWTRAANFTTKIWHSSWEIILTFTVFLFSILILKKQQNGR